ncbi:MAG: alanine racemase [SAR324 cluster bacterium]|nr:alanine racemase [SAR324 cluster bacterium]
MMTRPTVATINLDHLSHNLSVIKNHVKTSKIMAIVKANAYGHGLVPVARHLVELGIGRLGVAFLEEGITLRQNGIQLPILVLGGILNSQIEHFLDFDLELTISSLEKLKQVEEVAKAKRKTAVMHLKIDTGMERLGVHSYSSGSFIEAAVGAEHCLLEGVYSHLACSDNPESPMTLEQLERFEEALFHFERLGVPVPLRHLANSGGILHFPQTHLDLVRPGIILYGVYPDPASRQILDLKPVLSLHSKVVYFKTVEAHRPIGYGATWKSDHMIRVVTVPVGYGDGYCRALSNCGEVLIRGRRYPIVGRVCMDQFMVNLEAGTAYNGDEVVLIGTQNQEQIRIEEIAEKAGTIPYEILTGYNMRIPRVYLKNNTLLEN